MSNVWQYIGSNLELTFVAALAVIVGVITWIVMHRRHFCSYCGHYTLRHETERLPTVWWEESRLATPVRRAIYCVNPNCARMPRRWVVYDDPTIEEVYAYK